ncbi:MAG: hypothetical protein ACSLFA_28615 [Mycobacterium sp.]
MTNSGPITGTFCNGSSKGVFGVKMTGACVTGSMSGDAALLGARVFLLAAASVVHDSAGSTGAAGASLAVRAVLAVVSVSATSDTTAAVMVGVGSAAMASAELSVASTSLRLADLAVGFFGIDIARVPCALDVRRAARELATGRVVCSVGSPDAAFCDDWFGDGADTVFADDVFADDDGSPDAEEVARPSPEPSDGAAAAVPQRTAAPMPSAAAKPPTLPM